MLPMAVADSRGSRGDACVVDKSQHFESNGSSKQHGAGQMMLVPSVGAFVHKPLHTVPVSWWLADEPHVVEVPDSPMVNVCVNFVAAKAFDCRLGAVVHKNDADSCWRASPGWQLTIVLVTAVEVRASLPSPFRSKMIDAID